MSIYRDDNPDDPGAWRGIPVASLRLAARLQAAVLRAGLLTVGDFFDYARRPGNPPIPGLDKPDHVRVLRAVAGRIEGWLGERRRALEAEVLAVVREAEAARGGGKKKGGLT